jgi:hypothetical protein
MHAAYFLEDEFYIFDTYHLKKGMCLETHDHKNMIVFSKVLTGKVQVTSYDKIDLNEPEPEE